MSLSSSSLPKRPAEWSWEPPIDPGRDVLAKYHQVGTTFIEFMPIVVNGRGELKDEP